MFDEEVFAADGQKAEPEFTIATVESVSASGVTLVLDGQESSGGKKFKANACAVIQPGDRVMVRRESGTLIVEYPIGESGTRFPYNTSKIGFFGKTPIAKQTLSNSATVAQLITALKAYGLFT